MYWKPYIPSVIAVLLAVFFLRFQMIAAMLVFLGCLGYGIFHAICVSQILQSELEKRRRAPSNTPYDGPTLRAVTVRIARKIKLLE